jgi:uncharacterized phage protein (TIGR02218 family)
VTAKAIGSALATHVQDPATVLAWALEIVRTDAVAVRWCTGSQDATISGNVYSTISAANFSSITSALGLSVDNLQVTISDSADVLREDVLDGLWDAARYRIFQYNQVSPSDGIITWPSGFIGNIQPRIADVQFEARDFRQAMHQDTTRTHQYGCVYELGDAKCRKDLTTFTFTAVAVTSVTNNLQFTCSGLAQAAEFFTEGRLLFTTGPSANGKWRKIAAHATGGVITLDTAAIKGIAVGNLLTIIAGCTHRPDEDCRDKFANKVNYGGCDTKPPVSDLMTGKPAA